LFGQRLRRARVAGMSLAPRYEKGTNLLGSPGPVRNAPYLTHLPIRVMIGHFPDRGVHESVIYSRNKCERITDS